MQLHARNCARVKSNRQEINIGQYSCYRYDEAYGMLKWNKSYSWDRSDLKRLKWEEQKYNIKRIGACSWFRQPYSQIWSGKTMGRKYSEGILYLGR